MQIIPEKKMRDYLEHFQGKTSQTYCDCNRLVDVELHPYYYDEENNDVYFASICPYCKTLLIFKE